MGMFNSARRPRGFNHQYVYIDERKGKLARIEENTKRDLGTLPEKEFNPEGIRGKFVEGTTHLRRRKASGHKLVSFGIVLIIVVFLLYLQHYLATGSWSF